MEGGIKSQAAGYRQARQRLPRRNLSRKEHCFYLQEMRREACFCHHRPVLKRESQVFEAPEKRRRRRFFKPGKM
jgi:hypothetical protein